MPVETAADLAGMFDEDEFAEAAVYSGPGPGAAVDCLVVVDRGQGRRAFNAGKTEAAGSERMLWVRRAELDTVQRGGRFTLADGEELEVAGLPTLDHAGTLWSVELTIVE